jgi:hypothetical protein
VSSDSASGRLGSVGRRRANSATIHPWREERVACRYDTHCLEERLGRHVLEEKAARAAAERVVDVLVEVEGREHDHPRRALPVGGHLPGRLDAVHDRHAHVHEDDMRALLAAELHRLLPVGGGSHDAEVVLRAEQGPEPRADDLLVVDDGDTDGHVDAFGIGSSASTANPPSSAGPALRGAADHDRALAHSDLVALWVIGRRDA